MNQSKERALSRLRGLLEEAGSADRGWSNSGRLTGWKSEVQAAISRLFGPDSTYEKKLAQVRFHPIALSRSTPDNAWSKTFDAGMTTARALIGAAIAEVEYYEDSSPSTENDGVPRSRRVFVVHGHDGEMKQAVARFLERLGLEAVILHEMPNSGQTVVEKFERESDVGYAVVLLSPDDVGAPESDEKHLNPRARQNVILELGYFLGRLGRERVLPIVRGEIEIPSDFSGVVYVPFDGGGWQGRIVSELKHLGYDVDANKAF